LRVLHGDPESNLAWRISLELDQPPFKKDVVRESVKKNIPLYEVLPAEYKEGVIRQAEAWSENTATVAPAEPIDLSKPSIRLTSFEGSKGLSAQHVFILGLQAGELPRDANNIDDLEICKFIVALTRTRKQCQLIYTWRFSGKPKRPSGFISWISPKRKESITIDKDYWRNLALSSPS
jgi:superfamily I DNA/RNA helicase